MKTLPTALTAAEMVLAMDAVLSPPSVVKLSESEKLTSGLLGFQDVLLLITVSFPDLVVSFPELVVSFPELVVSFPELVVSFPRPHRQQCGSNTIGCEVELGRETGDGVRNRHWSIAIIE